MGNFNIPMTIWVFWTLSGALGWTAFAVFLACKLIDRASSWLYVRQVAAKFRS